MREAPDLNDSRSTSFHPIAERLDDILERLGTRVAEREDERNAIAQTTSDNQQWLPITAPHVEISIAPEYIQSEAFLEVSGFFTPSSKRIKSIYFDAVKGRLPRYRSWVTPVFTKK
jgi:hypothetical protein